MLNNIIRVRIRSIFYLSGMKKIILIPVLLLFASVQCQETDIGTGDSQTIADTTFVNLRDYSTDFVYDMRYATPDNFLQSKVYDCGECLLRLKTVKALVKANRRLIEKGFRIKLFDCYRPLDIQKRMWAIVSNPKYVADPKKGSIHNRGGAVDVTLVDRNGAELNMGTGFDHFGPEAAHGYKSVSGEVRKNRRLLRNAMTGAGFKILESEWWHYNLKGSAQDFSLSNARWNCD